MDAPTAPVGKSTIPERRNGRTHRARRQKYASGWPEWAHPPRLSTKVRSWSAGMGAPTAPVVKSTLPDGRNGRTHRACRQKYYSGVPESAHPPRLSTTVRFRMARMGAPTAPVDESTILERRNGRTHRACRQKYDTGAPGWVVGGCLWTALKRQSVKASKR